MKAFTKIAVLLGMVLLAFPMLADEPAAADEASQEQETVFGSDLFDDIRLAINHQAGSEFTVYSSDVVVDAEGEESSEFRGEVGWWPGSMASWRLMVDGDSQASESFYVNDSWQLDESFEVEEKTSTADE